MEIPRRRALSASFSFLLLGILSGCDTISGVNSVKVIHETADDSCITAALEKTPGVKRVNAWMRTWKGWTLLGNGPIHGSPIRYFTYDIGLKYSPTLMIDDYGDATYEISDSMLVMNSKMPRDTMNEAVPIMVDAEKQVAKSCSLEIDRDMKHTCDGDLCGPQ